MKKFNFIHFLIGLIILSGAFTVAKNFYLQPDLANGEKAPDFIGMLPGDKAFKLSDLKGHYVLLDFWGSWCGPCIQDAPELIKLHEKYSQTKFRDADGFAIVSVAVEKNKTRWENAIVRLGLLWPYHLLDPVNNFKFFDSPIANEYGVKQLPTKFLIDEKGTIVGVNMPFTEIEKYLEERK
ncbi:MAG: TlpA family protein disulfide reductase [Lewinellaceae bacterium]|nr:TlpA family protein disulfide reductase [Saprospiraceae bacterium]MCB9338418.1 TlpA family protein disulfide reductase [Lewinellaceae bacterium]